MNGESDQFARKVTTEQVVSAWTSVHADGRIADRLAETARLLGCAPLTVRRHLNKSGLLGSPSAVKSAAREAAARILPSARPVGLTNSAGIILADILQRQRDRVADLGASISELSARLRDLTGNAIDEDGNPIHLTVDNYAKAVTIADKLTATVERLHGEERAVWGIRTDAGSSFAQTLEELAAPPPVGHPPMQISEYPKDQPSPLPPAEEVPSVEEGLLSGAPPVEDDSP